MAYFGIGGELTKEAYIKEQESIKGKVIYERDSKTKSIVLVPDFEDVLNKIQCPVLAVFGEKDFVVDWRKTISLYKETKGRNNGSKLTVKTFPDGNHSILKCETGASNEKMDKCEFCDGYIKTITSWLKENGWGS